MVSNRCWHRAPVMWLMWLMWVAVGMVSPPVHAVPTDVNVEPATPAFVVIVHPNVDRTVLDADDLRALSLGRVRYWAPGEPVQLVLEPEGAQTRALWVETIAGMTQIQFVQYWIGATFRGRAVIAPRAVPDASTAVRLVAMLPGAIAIVPADSVVSGVKVVPLSADAGPELGALLP